MTLRDLPAAVRGALGFLSRLPVGHDEAAWDAFTETPAALPLAGYVLGALLAAVVLVPAPAPTVAAALVAATYLLTGVTHADGVADLGDAAAVHGDAERRREVLKDEAVGAGGVLALVGVVAGLALAALALAGLPRRAALLVVAAEVGAKTGMTALAALGSPAHEGLGSSLVEPATPRSLAAVAALALPAAALSWPRPAASAAAILAAVGAALLVGRWARTRLGGVSGDVLGAANELGRVVGLHAGVVAWTLS